MIKRHLTVLASMIASVSINAEVVKMTPLTTFVAGTNETLRAANAYTDAHSGGGCVDTNAVIDIIRRTVDGSARPLPPYLHYLEMDDTYPEAAAEWYAQTDYSHGSCSSVRDGNTLSRNYDWNFDFMPEFVVRCVETASSPSCPTGRYASLAVCNVGTNLTEADVTSGKWSRWYKALPGHAVDGINENGVVCNINVVDGDPQTSGWHTTGDLHPLGAIRWILDHATNAQHGAEYIAANILFPQGWTQNFQYMVCDETSTYIVENGSAHAITNGVPAITNFRLYPTPSDGEGQERYVALTNGANITSQWWTLTYTASGYRASDLPGITGEDLTNLFNYWASKPRESHRGERFGDKVWWQTVHTSVYDITNRTLSVAVQETDDWYTFAVPSAGGVKPEAVRELVDGSFTGGTNAVNAAVSEISNKLDSESTIPGTPYKASLKWENIGDGYELVMNGVPFHVYGGLFKVDSLDSIIVGGIPLSSTLSWLLPVSPDRELYPNPMIFWSGSELNVNGSATIYQGLSVAAPVIATSFDTDSWENYHANNEHLPAYLASGRWNTNTGTNRFARIGDIPPQPSTTTLRLYDETRDCYWIGKMVNGVLNWEVE